MPRRSRKLKINQHPFPDRYLAKLRYVQQVTINPGIGTLGINGFRCNGMYDPDSSGLGHQPHGFDQLMAIYDHYTVLSSKCSATFCSTGTTAASTAVVSININDNTSGPSSVSDRQEQSNSRWRLLGPLGQNNSSVTLSKYANMRKLSGLTHTSDLLGDNNYSGNAVSDPNEQSYFEVCAQALNAGDDPAAIDVLVTIEYVAMFTERRTLTQS